jgi:TRAP-type C4-dicarboxylate transport system substrate-binding protein
MKRIAGLLLLMTALFCIAAPEGAYAQRRKIVLKVASLVPENTAWGIALNRMSSEWARITNGEVEFRVYHNGVLGSEEDTLRKLRMNEIQGAILSSFGLNTITPEIMTLSCPFLIRNDGELDMILHNLKPDLEARINAKGFYTVAWARVGWVKIFSKAPVFLPGDLKRQKLGTNADELALMQAFKTMGYQMIPVAMNDVLIALNGGMIDAVYQSPIAVGGLQIFGVAKNMASINIAPFMGGVVLNRTAWRAVPERYKEQLLAANKRIEGELDLSIKQLEDEVIGTMSKYGLVVNQISPEQEKVWFDDVERAIPSLVGTTFDRSTYERIESLLKSYRSGR